MGYCTGYVMKSKIFCKIPYYPYISFRISLFFSMKKILTFLLLPFVLISCGSAPVVPQVSKNIESAVF